MSTSTFVAKTFRQNFLFRLYKHYIMDFLKKLFARSARGDHQNSPQKNRKDDDHHGLEQDHSATMVNKNNSLRQLAETLEYLSLY